MTFSLSKYLFSRFYQNVSLPKNALFLECLGQCSAKNILENVFKKYKKRAKKNDLFLIEFEFDAAKMYVYYFGKYF